LDAFVRIAGLLFGCPLKRISKECPFYALRNKPVLERLNYLKSLNRDELSILEKKHLVCSSKICKPDEISVLNWKE